MQNLHKFYYHSMEYYMKLNRERGNGIVFFFYSQNFNSHYFFFIFYLALLCHVFVYKYSPWCSKNILLSWLLKFILQFHFNLRSKKSTQAWQTNTWLWTWQTLWGNMKVDVWIIHLTEQIPVLCTIILRSIR